MFDTAESAVESAWKRGLAPDPILTVDDWANRHRMLSSVASAEPGRWSSTRTPYLAEIMAALSVTSRAERVVLMKGAQLGGPLALDTLVPTGSGWTTMGEIEVGEEVFDEHGRPCHVTGVSPVFVDRDCYEITFSDGTRVVCDADHPWVVWDDPGKRAKQVKTTTAQMLPRFKVGCRNRYAVDVAGALQMPSAQLPIDPYLLGYWLGNGSACMNHLTLHEEDGEIAKLLADCGIKIEFRLPEWRKGRAANILVDVGRTPTRGKNGQWQRIASDGHGAYFMGELRKLNLVRNKHIPAIYLRASVDQRFALLQGLMDADGHVCIRGGRCELGTAIPALRDDAYELIASLGLKPSLYERAPQRQMIQGRECDIGPQWRLSFMAYDDTPVFRLSRKATRQLPREGRRPSETFRRRIVDIRPVPSVPVRCISVDSPSHLYLITRAMIPTHNTEAGLNWLGYVIHHAPGPMLLVQPTVEGAKRVSKQRVDALIEASPELASRVKDPRSRDSGNTQLMKEFPGGVLIMTGANSAVGLRSMPVRYLFLDEVDGYPGDADGEGDPVALAVQRAATFVNRKVYLCSTPTLKGYSRIETAYLESDQRVFEVPCDHCGAHSQIVWRDIKWPAGKMSEAAWHCPYCEGIHPEYRKPGLLANGRWTAKAEGDGKTVGFHLSSLYSPWLTWGEIAQEHHAAKDDPVRLKVWVNTKLAETWEDREGETLDAEGLMERREAYGPAIPAEVALLTCGIDVQDDRLELEVVGWGRDEESWSVDYKVLWGDPSAPDIWAQLDAYLGNRFEHETLANGLTIEAACLDTGGHHTLAAYAFCKGRERKRIWAIKGGSGKRPIWPKRPSKANKGKVNLFTVGVDAAKEAIYARLKKDAGAGAMHFPLDRDAQYFEQLTAERIRTRYVKGFPQRFWWKPDGRRNEALDCRVYAYAALHGLLSMGLNLNKRVEALPPVPVNRKAASNATPVTVPMTVSPRRRRMAISSNYL